MLHLTTLLICITLAARTLAQQINSPTVLVAGSPVLLSWSGGQGPYVVDVIPAGQAGAEALDSIESAGTSATWVVSLPASTAVTFRLRDATGAIAFTSPVTIQPCNAAACRSASASAAASSSASESEEASSASASATETASDAETTEEPSSTVSPSSAPSLPLSSGSTATSTPSSISTLSPASRAVSTITSTATAPLSSSRTTQSSTTSTSSTSTPESTNVSAGSRSLASATLSAFLLGLALAWLF